jgi:hypothetical protein
MSQTVLQNQSAKRTTENSPAIYRCVASNHFLPSPRSGRPKVAQRFSAGNREHYGIKSAQRTAEVSFINSAGKRSVARFTGLDFNFISRSQH